MNIHPRFCAPARGLSTLAFGACALLLVACGPEASSDEGASAKTTGEGAAPKPEIYAPDGKMGVEAARAFIASRGIDRTQPDWRLSLPKPPQFRFDANKRYLWKVKIAEISEELVVELLTESAPHHVSNWIYLTELDYFNDLSFHRIGTNFMAQGGCPLGNGGGSPGYGLDTATPLGGPTHDGPGILSMANGGPGTESSQFFLTYTPQPGLDGRHTVFGRVVSPRSSYFPLKNAIEDRTDGGATEIKDKEKQPKMLEARIVVE